ncbi:hypothetical protein Mpsy_2672 [Methanolobus psychrophilus R15]|nr:hypothetical protein Mpsy_2672 [Methanolobus psychrophilus R15]
MILFILLMLMSSGCTEQDRFVISDNATITSLRYNTISSQDMETHELIINSTSMNLSIYSPTNQLKAQYINPVIAYQWSQVPYLLNGKSCIEIDSPTEAQKIQPNVPGSGTLEITVLQDGMSHTLTIDPSEYRPDELFEFADFMGSMKKSAFEPSMEEAQEITEQWITSMPTYSFDGSNLTLESHIVEETLPSTHGLIYTFTSSHEGYGDRSDEVLTETATNHTIRVGLSQRKIVSAVIDGSWDEIGQVSV